MRSASGALIVRFLHADRAGIHVAQKVPYVQVGTLLSQLDPSGALFSHDKVEGVATTDAGKTLYLSNDDDFGIDTIVVDPNGA